MGRRTSGVQPPTDDKRWRIVEATMRRGGFQPDALIETLHSIQNIFGFLDEDSLIYVTQALPVSPSQVYGVATFYHYFQLEPGGDHVCSVCTGTACHIKGGKELLAGIKEHYQVAEDETTEDGSLSLLTVRCLGACGLAPVVVLDGEVLGHIDADMLIEHIERAKDAETVDSNV